MASVVSPFLIVALLATASLAAAGRGHDYRIVAFGDSYSDTGIVYNVTGRKTPPSPFYWNGRFTNEPGNWQDWINAGNCKIHAANRAVGGALACRRYDDIPAHFTPTVAEQAAAFAYQTYENPSLLTNWITVPVIWAGHRDVVEMPAHPRPNEVARLPLHVAECLVKTAMLLLTAHVPLVVVATLAPMDLTPLGNDSWIVNSAVWHTNEYIKKGVSDLQAELSKEGRNQTVLLWDVHDTMTQIITNYTSFGFKYSFRSSCLTYKPGEDVHNGTPETMCYKPNDYIYYDPIHPTSKVHQLLSRDLIKTLKQGGIK